MMVSKFFVYTHPVHRNMNRFVTCKFLKRNYILQMGFSDMERPNMGWNLNTSSTGYGHENQQAHYSQADYYMTRPFYSGHDNEESVSS